MVDSIHHAGRIGVIPPPGQLRKVGHRSQARKDPREEGHANSQNAEEESILDDTGSDQGSEETCRTIVAPSDKPNKKRTGRRIDVRI